LALNLRQTLRKLFFEFEEVRPSNFSGGCSGASAAGCFLNQKPPAACGARYGEVKNFEDLFAGYQMKTAGRGDASEEAVKPGPLNF